MPPPEASAQKRLTKLPTSGDYLLAVAVILILGLWVYTRASSSPSDENHTHPAGAQGGVIISMGRDRYHAEVWVEQGEVLRLMTLGPSATEVIDVESQELVAYVDSGQGNVIPVPLLAEPQNGDGRGRTSQFAGQLPSQLAGKPIKVTIAALRIGDQRYRLGFAWPAESHRPESHGGVMPAKVQDDAERQLYLEPGGLYTAADIEANECLTASMKFAGFRAKHDFDPQPGDLLCPVTQTKANPTCDWIIDGRRYTFCCPPCIDEFVELAKQHPEQIRPPEAYVK